jgi:hypothetical protein
LARTLLSMLAPEPVLRDDEGGPGLLTLSRKPSAVEVGFILCGSETERNEGTRRGKSEIWLGLGSSRGVLASDDSSDPGDTGVAKSVCAVPS